MSHSDGVNNASQYKENFLSGKKIFFPERKFSFPKENFRNPEKRKFSFFKENFLFLKKIFFFLKKIFFFPGYFLPLARSNAHRKSVDLITHHQILLSCDDPLLILSSSLFLLSSNLIMRGTYSESVLELLLDGKGFKRAGGAVFLLF